MIRFMVIAPPRCGTAWAAAWLNTESTLCLHDPLWCRHYEDLDRFPVPPGKRLGVSCTGLHYFVDWLNTHTARKVVLHRPLAEINDSLRRIGLPPYTPPHVNMHQCRDLHAITTNAIHLDWRDLFENPKLVWEHLFPHTPFDESRHRQLREFNIQRDLSSVKVDRVAAARLLDEMKDRNRERFA
jgi:hypothetical protein